MKNALDKLLADILASSGYVRKTMNVFCKDGFCYPVDLLMTKVETTEAAIVLVGKVVEMNDKKAVKKLKQDALIPWAEVYRVDFLRESA